MATIIDSYSESNFDTQQPLSPGSDANQIGQSFTGLDKDLTSVKFYISNNNGDASGDVTAYLYAHSGTYGVSSLPTGGALATSDVIDASTMSPLYQLVEFSFSTPYTLLSSTKYVVTVGYGGANQIRIGMDSSSPSHDGNWIRYDTNASEWQYDASRDLIFYAYYTEDSHYPLPSYKPSY